MSFRKNSTVSSRLQYSHDEILTTQYVAQTVAEGVQLLGGENTYKMCHGDIVIWRGWSQIRVKPTGKTGRMEYVITYKVKDGKIVSYDELTDSGSHPSSSSLLCFFWSQQQKLSFSVKLLPFNAIWL